MPVADTVSELLAPVVATLGVELIDVEWVGSSLRVVVDEADGITTDRLAAVNRLISPILDQHDPIPGRYTLEVSSPGVERKLTRPEHFVRAIGEEVVVKLHPGIEPRRVKGPLRGFDDGRVTVDAVEIDGVDQPEAETHVIDLADIAKARTVFDWGPTPKKGGKPGSRQAAGQAKKSKSAKTARTSTTAKPTNTADTAKPTNPSDSTPESPTRSEAPGHEQ